MRQLRTFALRNYITLGLCAVALIAVLGSGLRPASGSRDVSPLNGNGNPPALPALPDGKDAGIGRIPSLGAKLNERSDAFNLKLRPASMASPFAAPALTATKTDNLSTAVNPGDTIMYTVVITNTGTADALNVNFTDTVDPNTTLVAGSVNSSPIAFDDSYTASGNIPIAPAAGVLANDIDPDTGTNAGLTVTQVQGSGANVGVATNTTATGIGGVTGSVTLLANGTFTYEPPPGFTGSDTFTYQISDAGGKTGTGTVTIVISNMVWFIDNTSAAANSRGTFSQPFKTIANFNTVNTGAAPNPQPGHHIVLRPAAGTYNEADGINLQNTQTLTGAAVAFNTVFSADANSTSAYTTFAGSTGTASTINATAGNGVDLASGNAVRGLNVGNTPGFFGFNGSAVGSLTIGTVSKTGTGGAMSVLTSGAFGATVNFGTLESTSSPGANLNLVGVTGTLGVTSAGTGFTGSTAASAAINISGGSVSMTYPGNVTKASTGALLSVAGGHTGTLTFNTGTLNASSGTGLQFDNADGTYNFNGTTTLNGGDAGVDILNGSGGTFSFGSGTTITNPTGTAFNVGTSPGSPTVTYSGSITQNTAGQRVVNIDGTTSNTITFQTGTITGGASSTGININNTNGNVSFANMTLGTSGARMTNSAVTINGGTGTYGLGAVSIFTTGAAQGILATNADGSITSASGTVNASGGAAINIDGPAGLTTLGMTLTSVSANGGADGIVLTDTNGSFTIAGDAGSTNNSSGGTIQNSTSHGISLSNTMNISLDQMNIQSTGGSGINGTLVTNFTFTNGTINNSGNAVGESNIAFNGSGSLAGNNLAGTLTVTNSTLTNAFDCGIHVEGNDGTVSNATITGNTITSTTSTATSKGDGVRMIGTGTATTVANLTKATISNNTVRNFPSAAGIQVNYGNTAPGGPFATAGIPGDATNIISITGNIARGFDATNRFGTSAIEVSMNAVSSGQRGRMNYDVSNNGTADAMGNPIEPIGNCLGTVILIGNNGYATMTGTVNNNVIVANNTVASNGIGGGNGIVSSTAETPDLTLTVNGNNIRQVDGNGILLVGRGVTGTAKLAIKNNTVAAPLTGVRPGIRVDAGNAASVDDAVCMDMSGNTTAGSGNVAGIGLRKNGTVTTTNDFGVEGMAATSSPGVEQFVGNGAGKNPGSANGIGDGSVNGVLLISAASGFSNCATAPIPPPELSTSSVNPTTDGAATGSASLQQDTLHSTRQNNPDDKEVEKLDQARLNWIVQAALARWRQTGIAPEAIARLEAVSFEVANLPYDYLAQTIASRTRIDDTAAGYGWYVDEFPMEDSEFDVLVPGVELQTTDLSVGHGKMDLLTVVMRELGVVYRQGNQEIPKALRQNLEPLMLSALSPGTRHLPLNQLRTTLSPTGSINPAAKDNLKAQSSATLSSNRPEVAQAEKNPARVPANAVEVPSSNGTTPADARYAVFNPATDKRTATGAVMRFNNASDASSYAAIRARRVAAVGGPAATINIGPFTLPPGKSTTIMFSVTVNALGTLPPGTSQVCNQGFVSATGIASFGTDDPDTGAANDATCTKLNVADLAVTKSDAPDPVIAGNNITYTVNFVNNGPAAALTTTVTDAVPANTTFVSAIVTTGAGWGTAAPAVGGTGNIIFSKASVASGETAVFTIVVKVTNTTPHLTVISNSVTAASTTTDTTPANNTAAATTTVTGLADLAVTKSASPTPNVVAGNNITYTINFSNNGPGTAINVAVTDAVPANATFVSAVVTTGSGWGVVNPAVGGTGNVVFSKASVPSGETAVFTVVVNIAGSVTPGTIITNNAVATADTSDPTPANNTGTATTTVIAQADLAVTKTDTPDPVIAGNNITYTINFVNNGPGAAQTVTVTDAVPANTTFVSAVVTTGSGWGTAAPAVGGTGNIVFSKASVPNAETAVFTVVVKVNSNTANLTTITNNAVAASTTPDPTPANNTGTATTTVNAQADLAVTKTDSPDPVGAGANITYTINFVNNGPSDAQTVTVTDAVPANTTFVSAVVTTGSGWGTAAPAVGGTGNIVFSKATVVAAETAVFTVVVKVNSNTADGVTITNSATAATTTTDPTSGNNTATATTTVQTRADLAVTKSDSPDPVSAGANLTYTINFANNGPSDAQVVMVTDAVPANTTFVSAVVTLGAGWGVAAPAVGGTGNIVFSKATVVAGETAVFTIIVNVGATTASGTTITNTATAASTTVDPTPANNSATATTTVQTSADLAITKTDAPDPSFAGNNITYTINFVNNGPSDAQAVTVTDAVPTNTTFVSATVTTGSGWGTSAPAVGGTGNVVFSKATVAAGETAVFTIVVKVDPATLTGTVITNTATAASTTTDPTPANNTATATTDIQAQADLQVTKSDAPDPVFAGANITYTINFVNNGPGSAQAVTVTDATPANTTFVSAVVTTGSGWGTAAPAVGGTGNVVFSKATVANAETAVFTVVVKVNSNTVSGTTISNSAVAASTTADPTPANNTGTATTTVNTQADLSVVKTDAPDPVIAGANITYTINLTNNGPSDAQTVTVTDSVPANTSLVSATVTSGSGWVVGGSVTFSKGTVAAGETATFQIVVKVNSNVVQGTVITNTATAATATTDPNSANNTSTATTDVIVRADLAVTKTDSPDPVIAGNNLTYTINYVNSGPSDAQTVTVTDAVPANATFVSAVVSIGGGWGTSAPAVGGTGNVVFSKATSVAGDAAQFTIVVNITSSTANGTTITNNATAASATTDPTPGNNTGTATTTVQAQADLAVTKSDSPDPVNAGSNITYTINFANNGPSFAQSVTVTDAVPANATFVSAVVTTGSGWSVSAPAVGGTGNIVFSKSPVANGETAVFTVVVKVNSNTAGGTTITNSATAASTTTDPTPANNTGTATTTVATMADLAVTKSDSPDPVIAGNNLTYTINLANNGPSDAQTVTVTDAVPANATFVSAVVTTGSGWSTSTPPVGGTGNVVFSKAMVVNGETAVFTIVVHVNANTANGATITNSATAASATGDPTPGNNTGTATTTVQTSADLTVTKSDSPDPVNAGSNLTYTINFANNGPSDAQTVTVTDAVPANATFVSAVVTTGAGWGTSAPAVGGTGNIVFSKATVAAGETAVFTIVVHVNSNTANGATITNSATAASSTSDPTLGNNTGTATTTVQTSADLAVTKSDSPDPVFAGNNLTYTINFANNGPSDAQTVTVTDAVPVNTTFVSATVTTGSGWSVSAPAVGGTGNVVFSKATVVAGETAVFTIVVKVNGNTANGATITNSAVAASATADPTPGNNTGTATTTVQTQADLAVVKTDSPDPVVVTQNLTYTINFVNNGPSFAQTVTVTDPMPANTTFVSATVTTGSGWSTSAPAVGGTGTITFSKASVAGGETAVFTIVLNVNLNTPNNTVLTNTATAASATADGTPGNNSSTTTTLVLAQADLAVTKSASPNPACVDGNIVYTINFVNNGPGPGLSTTVTDVVPANTTFVSATVTTGSGWSTSAPAVGGTGNVVFSKASVGIGESAVFQIVVKVNAGTIHGTVISNSATAASTIPDPTPGNNTGTATTTVDPIPPTITCPANIVKSTDPNQCSAVVTYAAPTVTDNCPCSTGVAVKKGPTVQTFCVPVCNPPSGSTFLKGTTTVNCSATDAAGNQSTCSFTVTVNDTQPPSITCPADITTKTPQAGNPCVVVNYPPPVVTDNCPLPTVVCTPPSGSCFPVGTTTVTCTATDTSGNTATCTFKVNVFDLCVQDDSDPTTVVLINSLTGDYRFCCHGVTYTGRGTMTIRGSTYQMEHNPLDRRVLVKDDEAVHKGSGSISAPPGTIRCTITDRNTQDNSCVCQ